MRSSQNTVVQDRIKKNGAIYGNKASNLMELDLICKSLSSQNIHIEVPQIFPIADDVIKSHLDSNAKEWRTLWDAFVKEQGQGKALTDSSKAKLKELRDLVMSTLKNHPVNESIINAINLPVDTLFMVRSTGEEDTVDMANPGGNKSVAAVKLDVNAISNAISVVVGSYMSEKSLTQRLLSGDDISKPSFMPVLIQRMIGEKLNGSGRNDMVVSGVMYAHEADARIDAAPGHGELIVNSKAPFDTYDVTQEGLVHAQIYKKDERLVPMEVDDESVTNANKKRTLDQAGLNNNQSQPVIKKRKLVFKQNPKDIQSSPSFPPHIAKEIAVVGEAIAKHYGMPMDVEYVYHPHDNILYLVQARPIPQDVHHKINPSAIAPDQWATIKDDNLIAKIKCHVVKDSGNAAKVITSQDQVIVKEQLAAALKYYLSNPGIQGKVKAIFIEEDAPSTSHEAAFFNALGIPVLQTELTPVKGCLEEKNPVIIVDPQHQVLVNWTNKIKEFTNAEIELGNEKIVTEGLFVSSLSTSETLLPFDYEVSDAIKETIKSYLSNYEVVDKKHIYSQLLHYIELVENVKINNANESAFSALKKIANIFMLLGTSARSKEKITPHFKLFQHAMPTIAEIDHCLIKYSNLSSDSEMAAQELQQLLDSVARLKALIINPGKAGLYSDSIVQIAAQNKALKNIDENTPAGEREFLQEFLKLEVIAMRQSTKDQWREFAIACAKNHYMRQLLAKIILTSSQYHIESELVNGIFIDLRKNINEQDQNLLNFKLLVELDDAASKIESESDAYHIRENERLITSWENRIDSWSDPARFTRLFEDYEREIIPLINKISIDGSMLFITRQVLLKQVQRLTEMMDKSIKSLKGSPEYAGKTDMVVERFVQLLTHYFELMKKWMSEIPDVKYEEWSNKISKESGFNNKKSMLEQIEAEFLNRKKARDAQQLEPSGYLSVASARVDTSVSFYRQFVQLASNISLEDLFSLMHQNLLASTVVLGEESQIKFDQLPDEMQPILNKLKSNKSTQLLGIIHNHPVISVDYNIPLDNHSAKLTISYNSQTQLMSIQWGFYGRNWSHRMDIISRIMSLECLLLNCALPYEPAYNEKSRSLECIWKIEGNQIAAVSNFINEIIKHYSELTENLPNPLQILLDRHIKTNDSFKIYNSSLMANIAKKIENEILLSNLYGGDLLEFLLINTYLIEFLKTETFSSIDVDIIYDSILNLNFDKFILLTDVCKINVDINFRPSSSAKSLFERILMFFSADDINKFIDKYKPDLSKQNYAIDTVIKRFSDDAILIKKLVSHGAPLPNMTLRNLVLVYDKPDIMTVLEYKIDTWDNDTITKSLYNDHNNLLDVDLSKVRNFIKTFKSRFDFNYKRGAKDYSLLEQIFLFCKSSTDVAEMADLFSQYTIDLSIHKSILANAISDTDRVAIVNLIIKNGINFNSIGVFGIEEYIELQDTIISLFEKLPSDIVNENIYNNLVRYRNYKDYANYKLIANDRFFKLIDLSYRKTPDDGTLLEVMTKVLPESHAFDLLNKYKPDLSKHDNLIIIILSNSKNDDLVLKALTLGAPILKITNNMIYDMIYKVFVLLDQCNSIGLQKIQADSSMNLLNDLFFELYDKHFSVINRRYDNQYTYTSLLRHLPIDKLETLINANKIDVLNIVNVIQVTIAAFPDLQNNKLAMAIARKLADKHSISANDMKLLLLNNNTAADCASLLTGWSANDVSDWIAKYKNDLPESMLVCLTKQPENVASVATNNNAASNDPYHPGFLRSSKRRLDDPVNKNDSKKKKLNNQNA